MKKTVLIALTLLSSSIFADTTNNPNSSATSPPPVANAPIDITALEAKLNNLQDQIKTLQAANKQENQSIAKVGNTDKPFFKTDSQDPYVLLDKPMFASMPRPSSAYNMLKAKSKLNAPVVVGGIIQSDIQYWKGNTIPLSSNIRNSPYQQGGSVGFTGGQLITAVNLNRYVTGIAYIISDGPGYNVIMNRGFVMVGNLDDNPFYFTIGRNFLPFGLFPGNAFLQNPVSTNTFRSIPIGQAVVSYAAHGFNIDAGLYQYNNARSYAYIPGQGTVPNGNTSMSLSNYFANIRYNWDAGKFNYSLGTGYLSDIRQTLSMIGWMYNNPQGSLRQTPATPGYGTTPFTGGQNPVIDFNATINYNKLITGFAEYTQTLHTAQFNGVDTGRFASYIAGIAFTPTVTLFNHSMGSYLQVNYSGTQNMRNVSQLLLGDVTQEPISQNLGIQHQATAQATFEVMKNFYVGPEFQYDWMYNNAKTWVATMDISLVF